MKKIIRRFIVTIAVLYILIHYYPGFTGSGNWQSLLVASALYLFLEAVVKPILRLFLIPINFLTLGFAGFIVNLLLLYIFVVISPGFDIQSFNLASMNLGPVVLPSIEIGYLGSLVITSFLIGFISSVLQWFLV